MIKIHDKTFNYNNFKELLNYIDNLIVAEKLCGHDIVYELKNAGQNYMGYMHVVRFTTDGKKGFNLYLYENQSLLIKGVLAFKVEKESFNYKEEKNYLFSLGYDKVDIKKGFGFSIVAIHLKNLEEKLFYILNKYRQYIFN